MEATRSESARKMVAATLVVALVAFVSYGISGYVTRRIAPPRFQLIAGADPGFTVTSTMRAVYISPTTCNGATTAAAADLYPGTTRCLVVVVHDPLDVPIQVSALSMAVATFSPSSTTASDPACTTTMVTPATFPSRFTVTGNSTENIYEPIALTDSGNQDNCEHGVFHFTFTATATFTDSTTTTLTRTLSGTSVTLTASVAPSNPTFDSYGPATATADVVRFYSCTTSSCSTITPASPLATKELSGAAGGTKVATASDNLTGLTTGTHYFEAVYTGTATGSPAFASSTSSVVPAVVRVPTSPEKPAVATRIYGSTPDATAANELEEQFTPRLGECPTHGSVVVARDTYFSDALASQYLAAYLGTGTLLTPIEQMTSPTEAAIRAEGITHVYVVGGPLAVSTAVVEAIEALPAYECGGTTERAGQTVQVTRVFGASEFDTADAIASYVGKSFVGVASFANAYGGTDATGGVGAFNDTSGGGSASAPPGPLPTAILATGADFQDAEAASVVSYDEHLPILLTEPTSLSPAAISAIQTLHIGQVVAVGGPDALTDTVVAALEKLGVSVLRVAGDDYTDTAVELAKFEMSGDGLRWAASSVVAVARGDFSSDGLAGAVLVAGEGNSNRHDPEPLLLTESPTVVGKYLDDFFEVAGSARGMCTDEMPVTSLTILGGPLAVSTATVDAMLDALERR